MKRLLIALVFSVMASVALAAAEGPGIDFDLQGFIDKQIAAGNKRVVVPSGRYRVTPRNREHLSLRHLRDLQIEAHGVEMICTETTRALTVSHCTNLTIRGLVIDYDPLPFTQGRLTGFSADKKVHEIELFKGYPSGETVSKAKYEIFAPDTRTLRCGDHNPLKIEVVDPRHIRVINDQGSASDLEQVGDIIAIASDCAPHGSAPHAVECSENVNVRLEDVELFASNCFGFLEYNCSGSTYYRCKIDRRPAESDPIKRGAPRIRSLNADAYHSKHAIKGPSYIECAARYMGDDCVNICGDYHMIMGAEGKKLRVLAKGSLNIEAGDPVELVSYDGARLPDATVISIQAAGAIREDETAFLSRQNMDANLKSARALTKAFTIILDREVGMARGGVICSANRVGNGFAVKGCNFGFNRSRGILIKASHGEVSGNRMEGCWMSAILVSPEYWWLEAGSSSDLKITGNTIAACKGIAINIEAIGGNGKVAPAGAHSRIEILNNRINECTSPAIRVTSTDILSVENNTFLGLKTKDGGQPVILENCARAVLKN